MPRTVKVEDSQPKMSTLAALCLQNDRKRLEQRRVARPAKVPEGKIALVRVLGQKGAKISAIAAETGLSAGFVSKILKGKARKLERPSQQSVTKTAEKSVNSLAPPEALEESAETIQESAETIRFLARFFLSVAEVGVFAGDWVKRVRELERRLGFRAKTYLG